MTGEGDEGPCGYGAGWRPCDGNHRSVQCARYTDGGWGKCRSQGDGCGWLLELLRKQSRQKYKRQGRAENGCWADGGAGVQRTTGSGRDGGSEELT